MLEGAYHFALGLAIGAAFAAIWEILTCKVLKVGHLAKGKGLHFHHSLFGPGAWLVLPFFTGAVILVAGIGAGVIAQHYYAEGFAFITRADRS